MKLDTTGLFKRRDLLAVTYQESHDELLASYDKTLGLDTGRHNIGMSDFEDPTNASLYEIWMELFVRERMEHHFGYNFTQFLDQPRWKILLELKVAKQRNKDEHALAEAIKNEMPK